MEKKAIDRTKEKQSGNEKERGMGQWIECQKNIQQQEKEDEKNQEK